MREVQRKCAAPMIINANPLAFAELMTWLETAECIRTHQRNDKNKLNAPEVECIGKGKAMKPYDSGVKVSLAVTQLRVMFTRPTIRPTTFMRAAVTMPWIGVRGPTL